MNVQFAKHLDEIFISLFKSSLNTYTICKIFLIISIFFYLFTEVSKNVDTDLKIILLNYQNNYVEHSG